MEIAADGSGGVLFVWIRLNLTTSWDLYAQRVTADGSLAPGWPPEGVPVCEAPRNQFLHRIVADGSGGAYIAWTDFREGDNEARVRATHILADGTLAPGWIPDGNLVVDAPGTRAGPEIVPDGSGGLLLVWGDSRNSHFYVMRLQADGMPFPGWPADGVPAMLNGAGAEFRGIVADGLGGALIAWNDNRNGLPTFNPFYYDIYAQHVLPDGTIDPRWPADGRAVCNAPSGQYWFSMDTDGDGGAVILWQDFRNQVWQMFAQRLRPDGTLSPGWVENGNPVTPPHTSQYVPRVVSDGAGGLYAFWEQFPTGEFEVHGQRLLSNGSVAPGWPAAGLPMGASTTASFLAPWAASDGVGGALVVFIRGTSVNSRVHAQRVQLDGPVATLPALVDARAEDGRVTLRWQAAEAAQLDATVERTGPALVWTNVGRPRLVGVDLLVFEDAGLSPGRYGYRLRWSEGTEERTTEVAWVEVAPAIGLALLGFRPNPAVFPAAIEFALPDDRPATLQVVDLRGRVRRSRAVGGLGAGRHVVTLERGDALAPGIYWIRLTHGGQQVVARGVVLP